MQTKCHVQLRGRGSGTLEPETNQERGFNMIQRCNVLTQNSFYIILSQVELLRVLDASTLLFIYSRQSWETDETCELQFGS